MGVSCPSHWLKESVDCPRSLDKGFSVIYIPNYYVIFSSYFKFGEAQFTSKIKKLQLTCVKHTSSIVLYNSNLNFFEPASHCIDCLSDS